jgi:hypothetical protein
MFVEIDPEEEETLKIAERLLNDSQDGKKTIEEIKKIQETPIETSRRNNLKDLKCQKK